MRGVTDLLIIMNEDLSQYWIFIACWWWLDPKGRWISDLLRRGSSGNRYIFTLFRLASTTMLVYCCFFLDVCLERSFWVAPLLSSPPFRRWVMIWRSSYWLPRWFILGSACWCLPRAGDGRATWGGWSSILSYSWLELLRWAGLGGCVRGIRAFSSIACWLMVHRRGWLSRCRCCRSVIIWSSARWLVLPCWGPEGKAGLPTRRRSI